MLKWMAAACVAMSVLAATIPAEARSYGASYAKDRAEIEDLQARYMFALDWWDADVYAETFTEDGVLDWAGGIVNGREAIRKEVHNMRAFFAKQEAADAPKRPARLRHFITNIVLDIQGDRATGRAYWFEFNNDTFGRYPYLGGYGHYDDEMRKVKGKWLFTRRRINNEMLPDRVAPDKNPAW